MKHLRFSLREMFIAMAVLAVIASAVGVYVRTRVLFYIAAAPGDEVYMDDHFLGIAPVGVSRAQLKSFGYSWRPDVEIGRSTPTPMCGVVFLYVKRSDGTSPLIWSRSAGDDGRIECQSPWGTGKLVLRSFAVAEVPWRWKVRGAQFVVVAGSNSRDRWDQGGLWGGGTQAVGGSSLAVTRLADELEVRLTLPNGEEEVTAPGNAGALVRLYFRSINSDKWANVEIPLNQAVVQPNEDGTVTLVGRIVIPPSHGVFCAYATLYESSGRYHIEGLPWVVASECVFFRE